MSLIKTVNLKGLGKKRQGKTRDLYVVGDRRIIISTDRISAFDVNLGHIPHKGQVLNQIAAFWFDKTMRIIPNHLLALPHPNVMIVRNLKLIPIEMVVRGYISGVTDTSIWGSYAKGERTIYGVKFPHSLKKNQKLPKPVITPTTKAESGHDLRLTAKEIVAQNIVSKKTWTQMQKTALALFKKGTEVCAKAGIILVDTKYEFGLSSDGSLVLIDEIHTPDSSRFWIKKTYQARFKKGLEPENFDKEFLRLWYREHGYAGKGKPPKMTREFIAQVSKRYIEIYQKITGKKFIPSKKKIGVKVIESFLKS